MSLGPSNVGPAQTLRALSGRWRELLDRPLARNPAAAVYVFVVTVTTLMLRSVDAQFADELLRQQSTNIVQMSRDAPRVLVLSAFFLESRSVSLELLAATVLLVVAERTFGTRRWLVIAASGHIGASMATTVAIWLQVRWGWSDPSVVYPVDVGASYVVASLAGALVGRMHGRRRVVLLTAAVVALAVPLVVDRGFTDAGHACAFGIGATIAGLMGPVPPVMRRTRAGRWLAQSSNALLVVAGALALVTIGLSLLLVNPPSTASEASRTALARATVLRADAGQDAVVTFAVKGKAVQADVAPLPSDRGARALRVGQRRIVSYERSDPEVVTLGRNQLPVVDASSFLAFALGSSGLAAVGAFVVWLRRRRLAGGPRSEDLVGIG